MVVFNSIVGLREWVGEHCDPFASLSEVREIVEAIQSDPSRPAWGSDWSEYLDALPDLNPESLGIVG